jgi:hypothetical protein
MGVMHTFQGPSLLSRAGCAENPITFRTWDLDSFLCPEHMVRKISSRETPGSSQAASAS